jgi:hypothetical protein
MNTELLVAVTVLTGLMRVPYILDRLAVRGLAAHAAGVPWLRTLAFAAGFAAQAAIAPQLLFH